MAEGHGVPNPILLVLQHITTLRRSTKRCTLSRDGVVYDSLDGKKFEAFEVFKHPGRGEKFCGLNPAPFTFHPNFARAPNL